MPNAIQKSPVSTRIAMLLGHQAVLDTLLLFESRMSQAIPLMSSTSTETM